MPEPAQIVTAKLVIVVGPFELGDHLAADLKHLGATGFTTCRVDGHGAHGPRRYGLLDGANIRFEVVVTADLSHKILSHVATAFEQRAVMAYSLDIEAVPFDHFG